MKTKRSRCERKPQTLSARIRPRMTEDGTFLTRADQVESFILEYYAVLRKALRSAAMVGACEERDHCLDLIREGGSGQELIDRICKKTVLEVLGYD